MARRIANYGDLISRVEDYLNRTNLNSQVRDFIYLADRKIFRWYRSQNNEKIISYDMRANPSSDPDDNEIELSSRLELQGDYLETLTLQSYVWDGVGTKPTAGEIGKPLRRISQDELMARRHAGNRNGSPRPGEPEVFARIRDSIYVHPSPAGLTSNSVLANVFFSHQYYCDFSGTFDDTDPSNSDHDVLRTAPDLYIYGALLEAEPFLKPEDDAYARLPVWKRMYEEAKQSIIEQNDAEKYSGSVNEVNNAFGGPQDGRATDFNKTGWA